MKLRGRVLITAFDCVMLRYDAQTGQLMHIYTDRTLVRSGAHDVEEGMHVFAGGVFVAVIYDCVTVL